MSAFDRLSRMCGPQVPPELLAELNALRAEERTKALNEAIQSLHEVWRLAPESSRADGINFAIGALMSVRDHPRAASSSRTAADEQPESERLREELAAAKASAERHRENAYKQGQLAARRLDRARRAEAQRDTLEAELAQAIEHRDHWHGELKCADARIAELGAASSPRTADEQPETNAVDAAVAHALNAAADVAEDMYANGMTGLRIAKRLRAMAAAAPVPDETAGDETGELADLRELKRRVTEQLEDFEEGLEEDPGAPAVARNMTQLLARAVRGESS